MRRLESTSFLSRCRQLLSTRAEMLRFVGRHYHYARHFTRYLCALLSNIVREDDRRALTENLFEEMGLGGAESVPHAELYRRMMHELGVAPGDEAPSPATLRLVDTMLSCCRSPRYLVGLGALCLGAEAIVPRLYSTLLLGFATAEIPGASLAFFRIHIEEDDQHALTMRRIIERELARDPHRIAEVRAGAERALAARLAFFLELGRDQRAPEPVRGAGSRGASPEPAGGGAAGGRSVGLVSGAVPSGSSARGIGRTTLRLDSFQGSPRARR